MISAYLRDGEQQQFNKGKQVKTKSDYLKYVASVEHNTKHLSFLSTGLCVGCQECGFPDERAEGEPHFSWSSCECCGSTLGGDRHAAHGRDANNELIHLDVCTDCLYFINYGRLDDATMISIETT